MAGNIKTNSVQLGDSATATQNFVLRTNVDGTATLARGNVGATTQDVMTVNAAGATALRGTATNDNAASGFVGEYVEAQRLFSAPLAMTTAFAASVTSIPLTAGDWDVQGQLGIVTATTTTVSSVAGYIDTAVSALNLDRVGIVRDNYAGQAINTPALGAPILTTGATRISLSAPATVHLVGHAGFGNSTLSMFGAIHARRVR